MVGEAVHSCILLTRQMRVGREEKTFREIMASLDNKPRDVGEDEAGGSQGW